jgi:hypothetical protein
MSELKDPTPAGEPTRVNVGVGYKMNMGNYESANVNISVSASAKPGESASECVDRVFSLVEAKLVQKFDEMQAELSEAGLGADR